jgi:outer membrane biosynthesis protein TonB
MRRDDSHDGAFHAGAAGGAVAVMAVLGLSIWLMSDAEAKQGATFDLADFEAIEASIAYKKAEPQKQPQKPKREAEPDVKVDGVSRDADKPVDDKKKDEPAKKPDPVDPLADFRRKNQDTDLDVGKVTDPPGVFDPDAPIGWAEETKGDPYFRRLIADMRDDWSYPEFLDATGVPVGCIRLERDGRISDTLFKQKSGNHELDDSVERQLKRLEKKRNKDPEPVPDKLLKHTTRWICFKFEV